MLIHPHEGSTEQEERALWVARAACFEHPAGVSDGCGAMHSIFARNISQSRDA